MFDLSEINSFNSLENWVKECKKYYGEKLIPILIGNKNDLKIAVNPSDIEKFCNIYKMSYYELNGFNYDLIYNCFKEYSNILIELIPKEKKR